MTTPSKQDIASLKGSGLFDAERYRSTYPDVDILGMDPTEHYLKYGRLLGRMPADVEMVDISILDKLESLPAPKPGRALLEAHEICRSGDDALGLAYAKKHIPEEFAYTIQTLRANAALRRKDEGAWLHHLNTYLEKFKAAPIQLGEGATLFDRFTTAPLPAVTGGPLISVIMPAWNAEKTAQMAARSILNQTWRNLELVIVDDCSADGTWAKLQEIAASDSRVKLLRNKINVGPYVSKNIALSIAKGVWITGHDADDWALSQRLEQHMQALRQFPQIPRASITHMARMDAQGRFVRAGAISRFSIDGITRKSSISLLCDRAFFLSELGAWDCVRFGADSETIARAEQILGRQFCIIPQIGMLCLEHADSLTSHPEFGTKQKKDLINPRAEYASNYKAWHIEQVANGGSVRIENLPVKPRRFPAPQVMTVPREHVIRNASETSSTIECEPVTAICVSCRREFLEQVRQNLLHQTYRELRVIYVIHGVHSDIATVQRDLCDVKNLTVLQITDEDTFLADGLNLALDHCSTDLCAKLDDDDYYGPDYIRNAELALMHSGIPDVAITGKAAHFCYVESQNTFGLRFPQESNRSFKRIHGGTLFWRRSSVADRRFERVRQGTDTRFTKSILEKGLRVYSADPYDFVHVRYSNTANHTWQIDDADFLLPVTKHGEGLRLDLAYSSQHSIGAVEIPPRNIVGSVESISESTDEGRVKFSDMIKSRRQRWWIKKEAQPLKMIAAKDRGAVFARDNKVRVPKIIARMERIEDILELPRLPDSFVLKPIKGYSNRDVVLVRNGHNVMTSQLITVDGIVNSIKSEPGTPFIMEEFLVDENGAVPPRDFKFYCFGSKIAFIHIIERKNFSDANLNRHWFLTPEWNLLPMRIQKTQESEKYVPPKPACCEELFHAVKALGSAVSMFMRIDMYATTNGACFGEFTPQPHGGNGYTEEADLWLGSLWRGIEGVN